MGISFHTLAPPSGSDRFATILLPGFLRHYGFLALSQDLRLLFHGMVQKMDIFCASVPPRRLICIFCSDPSLFSEFLMEAYGKEFMSDCRHSLCLCFQGLQIVTLIHSQPLIIISYFVDFPILFHDGYPFLLCFVSG